MRGQASTAAVWLTGDTTPADLSSRGLGRASLARRLDTLSRTGFAAACVTVYFVLSLFAYLPAWPGDPHRIVSCACGDPVQQAWFIGWVPWAIFHGHNPFFTNWMEYPYGVNLAAHTEMPLLGLLTAPVTFAFGSVASFSLLLWLSYPLSATAAFFAIRRWTGSNAAAGCGGLLYGFSAYVVSEGLGHLQMSFVPLPPLIFMALHEVLVRQGPRPHRWGVVLGLLVTAQFLISPEVLATTVLIAAVGIVLLAAPYRREIDRVRLRRAWQAIWPAALIALLLLAYPVYYELAGPMSFHGPVQEGLTNPFRADLLSPFVPTSSQLFAPASAVGLGSRFTGNDVSEQVGYLGIPFVFLAILCAVCYWKDRWIRLSVGLATIAYVLSLGPTLLVATHKTSIPLPFDILGRIFVLENVLPVRLGLYQDFFVILIVSFAIAHLAGGDRPLNRGGSGATDSTVAQSAPPHSGAGHLRRLVVPLTALAVGIATVVSLVPSWPRATADVETGMPAFFTSSTASQIPEGSLVLTYPFAFGATDQAMLWQQTDLWRWRLVGGYASMPGKGNKVSPWPPNLQPIAVQEFLAYWSWGQGGYLVKKPPPADTHLVDQMRQYVHNYGIDVILLDSAWPNSAIVDSVLARAFGRPKYEAGVDIWFCSKDRASTNSSSVIRP